MKSYEVRIDIGKLSHYSEVLKSQMNNETLLMIMNSFSVYVKRMYLAMIRDAIYSRRYRGNWEPIDDEGYLEFIKTDPSVHIFDLIYDAIEIREIKEHIVIRIDPKYKYPNSNISLLRVLNAIENGTTKFNARPILQSIVRQLNLNILQLWRVYLKKRGVT